ncbi:MAG: DUF3604 domain-containing protein [Acidobacteriota bacterium]
MKSSSRREWIQSAASLPFASGAAGGASPPQQEYRLFWGDLHNHNAIGYAQGSLERTYEIARGHLDFLAFTPHAQWHDMPEMPARAEQKWTQGFQVLRDNWLNVRKQAAAHNQPGKFVSFLGYEWHSSRFGDHCIYFPDDHESLEYFDHVRKLQQFARDTRAILVPHHIAYKEGWRGANFAFFDPSVSPVMEIYSEHGLSESDRSGWDYITHSMGGRWTGNTMRRALKKGLRFGVIASSDDHLGYPGAYGEGLAGIYAKDLSRASLLDALRARRTIAVTGDRIELVCRLNGHWMGSSIPFASQRELEVSFSGKDEVERVDILKNDRVIHRHFPEDHASANWPGEALCRLEFGWGPWGALAMTRVCDWEIGVQVSGGKLLDVWPCFQSGPFDEKRRNRIFGRTERSVEIVSYTSRQDAFAQRATNAVILRVAGGSSATLEIRVKRPSERTVRKTLGELAADNEVEYTGPFQSESMLVHRLVTPDRFRGSFKIKDIGTRGGADWYLARVFQANGHQAWSSPIWVEGHDARN